MTKFWMLEEWRIKKFKKTNAPGCRTPPRDQVFFISFLFYVPSVLAEIDTSSPCGFSFSSPCQPRLPTLAATHIYLYVQVLQKEEEKGGNEEMI